MRKICPPVKKASRNHFGCVIRATNPQIHSPPGELCGGKRHFHSEEPFALGLASGSCTSGTVSYWTCNLLHKLTTEHVCTASVLYGAYDAAIDRNLKGPGHMPLRLAICQPSLAAHHLRKMVSAKKRIKYVICIF